MATDKIATSYAELEDILKNEDQVPRSDTEIAMFVAHVHGANPDGATQIRKSVDMALVSGFLGQLSLNGIAHRRRGSELRDFYGRRPTGYYWVHSDYVDAWALKPVQRLRHPAGESAPTTAPPTLAARGPADLPNAEDTYFNVLRGLEALPFIEHWVSVSHEEAQSNASTPEMGGEDGEWSIGVRAPFAARNLIRHEVVMEGLKAMAVGTCPAGSYQRPVYSRAITEEVMDAMVGEGTWKLSVEAGAALVLQACYGSVMGPELLRRTLPDHVA